MLITSEEKLVKDRAPVDILPLFCFCCSSVLAICGGSRQDFLLQQICSSNSSHSHKMSLIKSDGVFSPVCPSVLWGVLWH